MATKGKKSKLGHDPLSWISEADAAEIQQENEHPKQQETVDVIEEPVVEETTHAVIEATVEEPDAEIENGDSKEINMLDLPLYFGIAQVAEVYAQMQEILASDIDCIEIQAEDIESIDASAVQLLVVFVNAAKSKNKEIVWKGVSSKLNEAVTMFQLNNQLDMAA